MVIGHLPAGLRPGRLGQLRVPAIERRPNVSRLKRSRHVTARRKPNRGQRPEEFSCRIGAAGNGTGDANDHEQITQVCVSLSARGRSPLASATRYGQSGDCRAEQRAGSSTWVSVRWIGTPVAAGAGPGLVLRLFGPGYDGGSGRPRVPGTAREVRTAPGLPGSQRRQVGAVVSAKRSTRYRNAVAPPDVKTPPPPAIIRPVVTFTAG